MMASENRVPLQAVCVHAWLPHTLLPSLVAAPNHRTPHALTTIPIHSRIKGNHHSATKSTQTPTTVESPSCSISGQSVVRSVGLRVDSSSYATPNSAPERPPPSSTTA